MFRFATSVITLALFFASLKIQADQSTQAMQLLSYFSANCSVGDWTMTAVEQGQILIDELKAIQNDDSCKTSAGAIGQMTALQNLSYRLANTPTDQEIFALQLQEEQLLLSLSTAEASLRPVILSELRSVQVELARLKGYGLTEEQNRRIQERKESYNLLVSGTEALLNSTVNNQQCWMKYPSFLQSIGEIAGSVIAGTASASVALPLVAAVKLTGLITDYARKIKTAKYVKRVSEGGSSAAFRCVLESMSKHWCAAEDALHAIDLKIKAKTPQQQSDHWAGLNINEKYLPTISRWLDQVRAGVPPTSVDAAGPQLKAQRRVYLVERARTKGNAIIKGDEKLFNNAPTSNPPKEKWQVEKTTIQTLMCEVLSQCPMYGNGSEPGPLDEIYDSSVAPYYLLGIDPVNYPRVQGLILPFSQFDPFTVAVGGGWTYTPDWSRLLTRYLDWVELADQKVQIEYNLAIQIDPLLTLNQSIKSAKLDEKSPREAFLIVRDFFNKEIAKPDLPSEYIQLYADTLLRLNTILTEIELGLKSTNPKPAADVLNAIHEAAQLEAGGLFLESRIEHAVRVSLDSWIVEQGKAGNDEAIQFLAAGNIVDELKRVTGGKSLVAIVSDAKSGQSITQRNINSFVEVFQKNIAEALEDYNKLAKAHNEPADGANRMTKSVLCLSLLAADQWPKSIPFSLCESVQLQPLIPGGPSSIKITKNLFSVNVKPSERICAFRDYIRESEIYERYFDKKDLVRDHNRKLKISEPSHRRRVHDLLQEFIR